MNLDIVDFRVEEREHDQIEVFTKHVVDDYEAELSLFDESSGTKKLFGLLPFIAKVFQWEQRLSLTNWMPRSIRFF